MKRMAPSDVPELLAHMNRRSNVYVPQNVGEERPVFAPLGTGDLVLAGDLPLMGPKSILFPNSQKLFSFDHDRVDDASQTDRPISIFGLTAADAAGIAYLDSFFTQGYIDDVYLQRRQDALISTFISEDDEGGVAPAASMGLYDLQFVSVGKDIFVWPGSSSGAATLEDHSRFFEPVADPREVLEYLGNHSATPETLKKIVHAAALLRAGRVDEEFWEWVADQCIACGGCSYVCPTCTCFNVWDRNKEGVGARYRSWDSCILSGFSREGSGHNPRGKKSQRNRRRIEHKLMWNGPSPTNIACVGCGRCEMVCPVALGMPTYAKEIVNRADARGKVMLDVLERAADEPEFMSKLSMGDHDALHPYGLTPREQAALRSGDVGWIERYVSKLDGKQTVWINAHLEQEDRGLPADIEAAEARAELERSTKTNAPPVFDDADWSPTWLLKDPKHAETDILVVLERASRDLTFRAALLEQSSEALEGYQLTSDEQAAILSGDVQWIEARFGSLTNDQKEWLYRRLEVEAG